MCLCSLYVGEDLIRGVCEDGFSIILLDSESKIKDCQSAGVLAGG